MVTTCPTGPALSKSRFSRVREVITLLGVRYDFWFEFGNNAFHGVTYGDNTQVAHIRCLKNK